MQIEILITFILFCILGANVLFSIISGLDEIEEKQTSTFLSFIATIIVLGQIIYLTIIKGF
jgi:hypothetical protein